MQNDKPDIKDISDIKVLVNSFYDKVRDDDILAPIFNEKIQDRWPHHLEKMYTFWQTVLLEEHTYFGTPFTPHINLPIDKEHFNKWIQLFTETVNEHFKGVIADEALWRADKMALMFQTKLNYYRNFNTVS